MAVARFLYNGRSFSFPFTNCLDEFVFNLWFVYPKYEQAEEVAGRVYSVKQLLSI